MIVYHHSYIDYRTNIVTDYGTDVNGNLVVMDTRRPYYTHDYSWGSCPVVSDYVKNPLSKQPETDKYGFTIADRFKK